MCGIFGYAGRGVDVRLLAEIALDTEAERGGDAFGFAWVSADGRLRQYKASGRLSARPDVLEMAAGAVLVAGHCRYATNGGAAFNINNHPHPCDGGWLVHNGTVPYHRALAEYWGVAPVGGCDSEVLARLVEAAPPKAMAARVRWALRTARQGTAHAVLGVWARPGRMLAAAFGKPLHWTGRPGNLYVASLPYHLPGTPREFPAGRVCTITPSAAPAAGVPRAFPQSAAAGRPAQA